MHSLQNIWLVARREYLERVRAKSFLVMTILIPALMAGILGGAALANRHLGSANHIAVITSDPQFASDLQNELTSEGNKPVVDVYSPNDPSIRARLDSQLKAKDSTLDGYLVVTPAAEPAQRPTFEWVPKSKADIVTRARIADAVRGVLIREKLIGSGMVAGEVDSLLAPVNLASSGGKSDNSTAAFASAYGMFFLMYFVILFYGMNVARSIIEEKTSRVFEVLLATIKPTEMLAGKVIGVGTVGLSQVGLWIIVALAALKFGLIGANVHVLPTLAQTVFFVVFFLLGYILYSSVAAALGAMTNSEQELQQMNIFLMLPLIACSVVVFAIVTNPDGPLAKGISFFPFCTPLIMYMRFVVGKPGALQIGISIAELIVTIAIVLWFAARIYRVGILMYGKKPNLPEIMRWLKYS
ncbi:MAG TPA: ABC transporter permease [Candidatus Aquilonibacter sp.]|nr:ABC transporter permease [Candidatus Aquilonibacter sp.]